MSRKSDAIEEFLRDHPGWQETRKITTHLYPEALEPDDFQRATGSVYRGLATCKKYGTVISMKTPTGVLLWRLAQPGDAIEPYVPRQYGAKEATEKIMELLTSTYPTGVTLDWLSRESSYPKRRTFNLLKGLEDARIVACDYSEYTGKDGKLHSRYLWRLRK